MRRPPLGRLSTPIAAGRVFLLNVEQRLAQATVTPTWQIRSAADGQDELSIKDGGFEVEIPFSGVRVIYSVVA